MAYNFRIVSMVYRRNLLLDCMDFHGKCHQKTRQNWGRSPSSGELGESFTLTYWQWTESHKPWADFAFWFRYFFIRNSMWSTQ